MSSLTPAHALAYLREMSADFRAGIVLDAAGRTLAGGPALQDPATELLAAHPHDRDLHATLDDRAQVFAASDHDHAIVVVTGPHALPTVTRRDMRTALSGVSSTDRVQGPSTCPERALVQALVTAAADAFRP